MLDHFRVLELQMESQILTPLKKKEGVRNSATPMTCFQNLRIKECKFEYFLKAFKLNSQSLENYFGMIHTY